MKRRSPRWTQPSRKKPRHSCNGLGFFRTQPHLATGSGFSERRRTGRSYSWRQSLATWAIRSTWSYTAARRGAKTPLFARWTGFLPQNRVLAISGLSPQALVYRGGAIEGVLVIDEAEGQKGAEYSLRVAMSEGRVTRLTVNRSKGQLHGEELEVEVSASVITTTTAAALNVENATRTFDLWIDESEKLTRQILLAEGERAASGLVPGERDERTEHQLLVWQEAISLLEPASVRIPWAEELMKALPSRHLRARRDGPRMLALIRAHTLLEQRQRERDTTVP